MTTHDEHNLKSNQNNVTFLSQLSQIFAWKIARKVYTKYYDREIKFDERLYLIYIL